MKELFKKLNITKEAWQHALDSKERIERISLQSGKVLWLKKSAPARGIFRYIALNLISKLLRAPLLKAVPQKGGQIALDLEVERINNLQEHGILVPEIVAKDDGWILLKDIGDSIIDDFKQNRTDIPRIRKLFTECLNAIKQLHHQDQYMSQGFVRNMLRAYDKNNKTSQIGFIDFEDDPLTVMTLAQAQGRDLILFINSTARFFVKDSTFFEQQIHDFFKGHNSEVIQAIKKTNNSLLWVTKIPFQKALGHDYQKLKTGILALKNL